MHSTKHFPLSLLFRERQAIFFLAVALLPTLVLGLMGRHYASDLEGIAPIDLTNFSAIRSMFRGLLGYSNQGDSWIPIREALNFLHSDQSRPVYETLFFAKAIRFQYPLTSLLPFEFLSSLGLTSIRALNLLNFAIYCLNVVAIGVLALLLFRAPSTVRGQPDKPETLDPGRVLVAALAAVATISFYPLVRAVELGQIQVWIDALFTFSVIFWLTERRLAAGICMGIACTIKPQLALFLVWGALWRQKAFCAGMMAIAVPIVLISFLLYGLHNNLGYLDVLAFLSKHGESFFANNSVNGILNGYFSPNDPHLWDASSLTPFVSAVYAGTLAASLVAVGMIIVPPLLKRDRTPGLASLGAAAICAVSGAPVAWEHHYGILVPIYLVGLRDAWQLPRRFRRTIILTLLSLSWILVANVIPFTLLAGNTPFSFVQQHCFFGALLLLSALFVSKNYTCRQGQPALSNQSSVS